MFTYETLVYIHGRATHDHLEVPCGLDIQNQHVLFYQPMNGKSTCLSYQLLYGATVFLGTNFTVLGDELKQPQLFYDTSCSVCLLLVEEHLLYALVLGTFINPRPLINS